MNQRHTTMGRICRISTFLTIAVLAGCQQGDDPTEGMPLADIVNTDLVQLCERADLQDTVLDNFAEAMFKRNVANAGLLGSLYDQGLSEEKIRQETSIENARAKRHSPEQVDCTVDFVSDVSADNKGIGEIKFANAQYSLIQQPDHSFQVVAKKATFFANIFIDGTHRGAWVAERQMESQNAREADVEASSSDRSDEGRTPAANAEDECPYTDLNECEAKAANNAELAEVSGDTTQSSDE